MDRQIVGTAAHMSPEQALGQPLTPASDWYSVGVILYSRPDRAAAVRGHVRGGDVPEADLRPRVPRDRSSRACPGPDAPLHGPARPDAPAAAGRRRDPRDAAGQAAEGRRRRRSEAARGLSRSSAGPGTGRSSRTPTSRSRAVDPRRSSSSAGRAPGKTTLVRAFLDGPLARRRDARALAAAATSGNRSRTRPSTAWSTRWPVPEAAPAARGSRRCCPATCRSLARVFPVLQGVEASASARAAVSEMPDPQELRRRVFAALRELLARLGDRHPLVLAIDDLQWGDADSAALLADLLYTPDPPAMLFLGAFRLEDVEQNRFCQILRQARNGEQLDGQHRTSWPSRASTQAESRELALALLGRDDPVARAQAHLIARESAGNPLFIDELVKHLQAGAARGGLGCERPDRPGDRAPGPRRGPARSTRSGCSRSCRSRAGPSTSRWRSGRPSSAPAGRVALGSLRSARLVRGTGPAEPRAGRDLPRPDSRDRAAPISRRVLCAGTTSGSPDCWRREPQADPEVLADHLRGAGESARASRVLHPGRRQGGPRAGLRPGRPALPACPRSCSAGSAAVHRRHRPELGDALANSGRGAEAASAYLQAAERTTAAETLDLKRLASSQLLISGHVDEGLALLRTILVPLGLRVPATPAVGPRRAAPGSGPAADSGDTGSAPATRARSRPRTCRASTPAGRPWRGLSVIDPILGA